MTRTLDTLNEGLAGRYEVERELGQGGMATVYLARDVKHNRHVALKVLREELSAAVGADRFAREINIIAQMNHPHILSLYDSGECAGLLYYVMPFVDGESLRAKLTGTGMPVADAVRILKEIVDALAYAHRAGVVHRDIKPDNVMLSGRHALVTDFGIAKAVEQSASTKLTTVGIAVGTPQYMAPEQATAETTVDHRADIYAVGVIAYEMLTGIPVFSAKSAQAVLAAHVLEKPRDIRELRPDIPPALAATIHQCLAKDPSQRPQTADDLLSQLDLEQAPVGVRSARGPRIAAAAATAVLLGSIAWFGSRNRIPTAAAAEVKSLAVLPIDNIGGDSTAEYLADGMTGELANALRKVPGLRVSGDVSTFRFKHTTTSAAGIARQLGVTMLLTGRLQPGKDHVRLQVQLTDTAGTLMWSNTFDRPAGETFAIQDDITRAVASELKLILSPSTLNVARAGRTENAKAHDLFMRGQFEKNKLTEVGLRRSVDIFKLAIALDSNYAQAHAALSQSYDLLADVYAPSHEYHELSKEAALRAVRSDSLLAEGHVMLGFEIATADWNFPAGMAEMKRGLAMNPKSPDALLQYGLFQWVTGDERGAVATADSIFAIDPLSAPASLLKANALMWGEQFAAALKEDSNTKRIDPMAVYADPVDASALRELGHYDASVAAYKRYEANTGAVPFGLAVTYARMGRKADALNVIHTLQQQRKIFGEAMFIAFAYCALNDAEHALIYFDSASTEKASSARMFAEWTAPTSPMKRPVFWFGSLRNDPRLLERLQRARATTFTR